LIVRPPSSSSIHGVRCLRHRQRIRREKEHGDWQDSPASTGIIKCVSNSSLNFLPRKRRRGRWPMSKQSMYEHSRSFRRICCTRAVVSYFRNKLTMIGLRASFYLTDERGAFGKANRLKKDYPMSSLSQPIGHEEGWKNFEWQDVTSIEHNGIVLILERCNALKG
jgi:hypothetical protein